MGKVMPFKARLPRVGQPVGCGEYGGHPGPAACTFAVTFLSASMVPREWMFCLAGREHGMPPCTVAKWQSGYVEK